jgi:hypothetical protein
MRCTQAKSPAILGQGSGFSPINGLLMPLKDFETRDFTTLTDKELEELKALGDNNLLRSAKTLDHFAGVEASRRLRVATTWATVAMVALTIILVVLTAILVWLGLRTPEPTVIDWM